MPQILSPTLLRPSGTNSFGPSSRSSSWTHLSALYCANHQPRGPVLRNLAQRRCDVVHGGTLRNTAAGISVYDHAGGSFGGRLLPVPSSPRPFTIVGRVIRTTSASAGIFQQVGAPNVDDLTANLNAAGSFQVVHYGGRLSSVTSAIGQPTMFGYSESPGAPCVLWQDGVRTTIAGSSTGKASDVDANLYSIGSLDLLLLAIWVGVALQPHDFQTLYADPSALFAPPHFLPLTTAIAPPAIAEAPYTRRIDMPNRPYWRRWWYRKKVGEFG